MKWEVLNKLIEIYKAQINPITAETVLDAILKVIHDERPLQDNTEEVEKVFLKDVMKPSKEISDIADKIVNESNLLQELKELMKRWELDEVKDSWEFAENVERLISKYSKDKQV